jgi:hypothetical protein
MRTYRMFRILSVLIRSNAYRGLQRTRQIAFLRVHIEQLRPWLDRIPRRVQRPLERFLRFLLMMKPQTKIAENFPFQSSLAVCHVLCFEVRYFRAEDRPNSEVLVRCWRMYEPGAHGDHSPRTTP